MAMLNSTIVNGDLNVTGKINGASTLHRHKITMSSGQYGTVTVYLISSAAYPYSNLTAFQNALADIGPVTATYVKSAGTPSENLGILMIMYHASSQYWTFWEDGSQSTITGTVWSNFSDSVIS